MPKFHGFSLLGAAGAIALGTAMLPASAAELGVDFATTANVLSGDVYNLGWDFQDLTSVTVTALGTFDDGSLSNLSSPYLVGLWDCGAVSTVKCASGNPLIASATIDPSSSSVQQIGDWAFVSITPVTLTAGEFYAVGSQGGDGGDDYSQGDDVSVDPNIDYLNDAYFNGFTTLPEVDSDLTEPTQTEGFTDPTTEAAFFGANMEFGPASTAVPEPGSLALLGSALAGFGFFRRRKRS